MCHSGGVSKQDDGCDHANWPVISVPGQTADIAQLGDVGFTPIPAKDAADCSTRFQSRRRWRSSAAAFSATAAARLQVPIAVACLRLHMRITRACTPPWETAVSHWQASLIQAVIGQSGYSYAKRDKP